MTKDPHRPLREQTAFNAGIEAMLSMSKYGVDMKTQKVGTKKPITLSEINIIVQVAVRKALIAYQDVLDEEVKEEVTTTA